MNNIMNVNEDIDIKEHIIKTVTLTSMYCLVIVPS